MLLYADSPIDTQDYLGMTALAEASRLGHRDVVEVLLEFKADRALRDFHGKKTALEMAQESGHEEVVAQLQKPAAVIARQVRELS